jgi:phage terminase large subunit-like protein
MGLSNTAVPTYYGQFRDAVIRGEIPVNREISLEMNRIDALIANPNIYYDDQVVEGFIKFCEGEMTLTDGTDLHLLFTFKLWAEQIFGWYYFVERSVYVPSDGNHGGHYEKRTIRIRLIKKFYLIVARGAAKSMFASLVQAYFLTVDTSTTHQITTAPTMKQAEEVMSPFRTAITRARGPLFKFMTEGSLQNTTGSRMLRQKLAATKKGIENFLTGSLMEIRPMTINKLQGLRTKIATIDEWLSGDLREDVIGAVEQGASKLDDYLIIAISSEGTVRNGSGDTIKMELADILKGEYQAPHVSIWHYKLDQLEEVADPAMWLKANPNLGQTVTYETYQLDVERAEKFIQEGSLIVMPGTVLDWEQIYEDVDAFIIANEYEVVAFGYDPYNAKEFVKRWGQENGEFGIEKVIQGAKTESVPLGELKKLSEDRNLRFDQSLMSFAMGNAITIEDTNGNRKLLKKRQEEKIDNVAALMDAYIAMKANKEAFE